ncbi:hypothetical protein VTJ83DRAFT_5231 [Remersonia thermophila]|uniref:Uncharacterized protein n=1 Tax=Remersonia thermophila TaxID=72144 RepID=A0ABR4DC76_9PEZI
MRTASNVALVFLRLGELACGAIALGINYWLLLLVFYEWWPCRAERKAGVRRHNRRSHNHRLAGVCRAFGLFLLVVSRGCFPLLRLAGCVLCADDAHSRALMRGRVVP